MINSPLVGGHITKLLNISYNDFQILLTRIEPFIRKEDINFRISIPPMEILMITILTNLTLYIYFFPNTYIFLNITPILK